MSSRERIHHISCITNKSLFIVCGVGWEEKDLGITWSFTGKGGGEAIVANGVYGGEL